uniref:hypothetical protein n=1 Tax=Cetobacterium sp. TaxID=2071632 RepID=UPI003AEF68C7
MKEIGGYFQIEEFVRNEYYKDLVSLNTARNALLYIMEAKNIKKIYIPYYLCECIEVMLKQNELCYEFYRIDKNF